MVYWVLNPQGLQEILETLKAAKVPVWFGEMRCPKLSLRSLERSNFTWLNSASQQSADHHRDFC